jgi:cytochrome c biogenesis protein CcmG/thiol:disulfide interchange protein DsbE
MALRVKVAAQALAVAVVAALFALLVWKLVSGDDGGVARKIAAGKRPPAPNFTLPRLDRSGKLELASLRGKAVVLNFWASWCVPCKQEAAALERTWRRYESRGLVVVGVDVRDFRGDARHFMRAHSLTYPVVHDGPGSVIGPYGLTGYPETFFVGRNGRLVADHIDGPVNDGKNAADFSRGIELALKS